ncbi:MAG: DUF6259 domain-containing protein [Bacteroidota bacterium]
MLVFYIQLKKWVKNPLSMTGILYLTMIGFLQCSLHGSLNAQNNSEKSSNSCYFKVKQNHLFLGNSKIEISIDSLTGNLVGLFNKTSDVQFLGKGDPDIFRIEYSTPQLDGALTKDVWTAGYGSIIYGSKQKTSKIHFTKTNSGGMLEIRYDSLFIDNGNIAVKIGYTVEIETESEETIWRINIENNDSGTVKAVQFPILAGLNKLDNLIMPDQGGEKLTDPISKLSDQIPNVYLEYPARASMQWFDYYSSNASLYLASYDKKMAYTRMYFGRRGESRNIAEWMVKYPFVITGDKWESAPFALGIYEGDWHKGADSYRTWLQQWVPKPIPPKRISEMIFGGPDMYIKDNSEETIHTYSDIVSQSQKQKNNLNYPGITLVGWFPNGHDTYFPEYNAIPSLGGDASLIEAVNKVHSDGESVNAYMNGRIVNIETNTYKKFGKKWAVLGKERGLGVGNVDFFELQEGWNKTWKHYKNNEGWFSVMCPSAKGWQDEIVGQVLHGLKTYHFDGIFLDQPGSYFAELCYNRFHGHSTPSNAWGPGYLEILKRIHNEGKKINPEFALSTEGLNDVYGQYLDFHTDKNPVWMPMRFHPETETFVEMWRYALPWYITQNEPEKYSYPPSKSKIYGDYYYFLMGIRGLERERGEATGWKGASIADSLQHIKVVDRIASLLRKGGKYFFYGTFKDDIGLKVSDKNILAKSYSIQNSAAIPLWNTSDDTISFMLNVNTDKIIKSGFVLKNVTFLDNEKRIPYQLAGGEININMVLKPHQVEVLLLESK